MNQRIDLMPETYAAGRDFKRVISFWVLTACAIELLVLVFAFLLRWQTFSLDASLAPLREGADAYADLAKQVPPLVGELQGAIDRQAIVKRLVQEPRWEPLLRGLAEACAGQVWLNQLEIAKIGPQSADQKLKGTHSLTLEGAAQGNAEIIDFMRRLGNLSSLHDVRLIESQSPAAGDAAGAVTFKLTGTVNQTE